MSHAVESLDPTRSSRVTWSGLLDPTVSNNFSHDQTNDIDKYIYTRVLDFKTFALLTMNLLGKLAMYISTEIKPNQVHHLRHAPPLVSQRFSFVRSFTKKKLDSSFTEPSGIQISFNAATVAENVIMGRQKSYQCAFSFQWDLGQRTYTRNTFLDILGTSLRTCLVFHSSLR